MKFSFFLADTDDDNDIRKMLAECSMPGRIGASFRREPDFFHGCTVSGRSHRVYLGRNDENGEPAFLLVTADMPRYINGKVKTVGYLGNLRVAEKYMGYFLPVRAMGFLREKEAETEPKLYFSVVSSGNTTARRIFSERPRPSFPRSAGIGEIYTAGISVGGKKKSKKTSPVIRKGSPGLLDDIIDFLYREGSRKMLHPCYCRKDFTENGLTRGFRLEDMRIAFDGQEIIGTTGYWDQSAYKQTVVTSYDRSLRRIKPFYNTAASLLGPFTGLHPLPETGSCIKSAYAAFVCIKDDEPLVFKALLESIYNIAVERGKHYLLAGLSEKDPLLETLKKYRHISYKSSIFMFSLDGDLPGGLVEDLYRAGQAPYIEIAAL